MILRSRDVDQSQTQYCSALKGRFGVWLGHAAAENIFSRYDCIDSCVVIPPTTSWVQAAPLAKETWLFGPEGGHPRTAGTHIRKGRNFGACGFSLRGMRGHVHAEGSAAL